MIIDSRPFGPRTNRQIDVLIGSSASRWGQMIISQSLSTPENFLPEYGGCVPDALEARGEGWSAPFLGWPPNGADNRKRGRGHLTKRRAARLIADSFEKIASRSTSSSATRGVPQGHLRRRNAADVSVDRLKEWGTNARSRAQPSSRRPRSSICNGQNGASTTRPAAGPASRPTCRKPSS